MIQHHSQRWFTVYRTSKTIELRPGCEDYRTYQVIGTCRDYTMAFQLANSAAKVNHLPMIDYML
ncbi:MAG: hypothetical protein SAJ72_18555 [Jaaginema sp. PMC 1080.18]|nr:hypothetical protein [Jaaginema sp. PMC 1080.18]MEC4864775.1 hypothetical protein [Jaaginema sp. PMC 1078.18]